MWYSMFLFESKYKSASPAVTVAELLIADTGNSRDADLYFTQI